MSRRYWLPHPLASFAVLATWLILNGTVAVAHLLLGAFLAWSIPWATRTLWTGQITVSSWKLAVRLTAILLLDIVRANISVALLILGPTAKLRPAFVQIPLELKESFAISALASMITLTPGTVSCSLNEERTVLLVHVLDTGDAVALVEEIKTRYEAPLKEIFEC